MKNSAAVKPKKKTVLLIAVAAAVIAAIAIFSISLAEPADETGLTDCHPQHDSECGYVKAVKGQPCKHVHDESCGYYDKLDELKAEALQKAEEEALQEAKAERVKEIKKETGETISADEIKDDEVKVEKIDADSLVTSEMKEEAEKACTHKHDDSCGYVEAVEGQPCRHSCEKCEGAAKTSSENTSKGKVASARSTYNVNITSCSFKNADGQTVSTTVPFTWASTNNTLDLAWTLNATSGTFSTGDVLKITPIGNAVDEGTDSYVIPKATSSRVLTNTEGTIIGTWQTKSAYPSSGKDSYIEITLNSNANGATTLKGTIKTLPIYCYTKFKEDKVCSIKVGDKTQSLLVPKEKAGTEKKKELLSNQSKTKFGAALGDTSVSWTIRTDEPIADFYANGGKKFNAQKDLTIEDTLPSGTEVNLSDLQIRSSSIAAPMSESDTRASNFGWSEEVTDKFTKVSQNSGESYSAFKSRIKAKALQYGIYNATDGEKTLVVYFGSIPGNGLKYSQATFDSLRDYYKLSDAEMKIVQDVMGTGNAIGGCIPGFTVKFRAYYTPAPLVDTEVYNTAQYTVNGISTDLEAMETLKGTDGTIERGPAQSVKIFKMDTDNKVLSGAKFKLQLKNGSSWTDYTPGDGGGLVRATDSKGIAQFKQLGVGTYRFVETEAAAGYDKNSAAYMPNTFTIAATDTVGKIVTASNKKQDNVTVTFNMNGHGTQVQPQTIASGAKASKPSDPSAAGYAFGGWYTDSGCTQGFDFNTALTKSTTLYAKWTGSKYSVTYKYSGTVPEGAAAVPAASTAFYGTSMTVANAPTLAGYKFSGWSTQDVTVSNGKFTMPDKNVTLTGSWSAETNTPYKVEHYKQNIDGTYPSVASDTENKNGVTGGAAAVAPKTYAGYVQDASKTTYQTGGNTASGTVRAIAADGSLIVKLYYKVSAYTVEYKYSGTAPAGVAAVPASATKAYGASVTVANAPTLVGYKFSGWSTQDATVANGKFTMPAKNVTLTGSWTANTGTSYKVEHYKQNADGTYPSVASDTENKTGTTGAVASVTPKIYTGYTQDTGKTTYQTGGNAASGAVKAIAGDGSLVVKLYYKINSYTVTYKYSGTVPQGAATAAETKSVPYGQSVTVASSPALLGYVFSGWSTQDVTVSGGKFNMPAKNVTMTGTWKAASGIRYIVQHYQQDLTGSGYTLKDTDTLTGTTDQTVTAAAKIYPGFTEDTKNASRIASGKVKADGSLVLKLYYNRNTDTKYKVQHFKQNLEGTGYDLADTENLTATTGQTVTATAKTYPGFTENKTLGQRVASGTVAGEGTLVLKLYYDRNTNTKYVVKHYQEDLSKTVYSVKDIETLSGKTGATVTAVPKVYPGFVENTQYADRKASGVITGEGSLVLSLYYDRSLNTGYKVEHYKKAYGDKEFKLADTEKLTGRTGETANAFAKDYPGYTEDVTNPQRIASGIIAGDGSLVLKLYYTEDVTDVAMKKVWDKDGSGQLTKRPDSIEVQLYADGQPVGDVTKVTGTGNEWPYTFKDVEKYKADGKTLIEYSVQEITQLDNYNIGYGSDEKGNLVISNEYTGKPLITGDVISLNTEVKKNIKGDSPEKDSTFEFEMTAADSTMPLPSGAADNIKTARLKGAGEIKFGTMEFTKAGHYEYTISEANTNVKGYTYDKTVYTMTVDVAKQESGQLEALVNYEKAGEEVENFEFTNEYKDPGNVMSTGKEPLTTPSAIREQSQSGGSGTGSSVQTGDNSNASLYMIILITAAIIAAIPFLSGKRRKRENR